MKLYTVIATLLALMSAPTKLPAATDPAVAESTSTIDWMTDYEAAVAKAKAESKPLFLYFEGSNWCSWCKKMNTQIVNTSEFQTALQDKLVFVMCDFPRPNPQDKRVQEQNERLASQFQIQGFPTVVIVDSNQTVLEKLNFQPGGGALFAKKVQDVVDAYNKKKAAP